MDKTTWEEIKALASDFKRAQATSTNLKLSERNCIDIINYLCNNKHLALHFTTDGKTFLTPEELTKEIYEELEVNNGRVTFNNLCNSLDLDMYTIENAVNGMIQQNTELQIVMNCLINSSYIRQVSLKINEILKDRGKSTLGELIQLFELPIMFVDKLISNNTGTIIDAHKDGDMIYTNSFVRRHTAMIRGYLTRSSKPVLITALTQQHIIPEKFTIKIVSDLIERGRLFGKLENNKSVFIPEIYITNQKIYLKGFFQQNNYLQFSTMKDVGVHNPIRFAEVEFPGSMILSTCIVGMDIVSQLEAAVQECDRSDGYLSCYESLPTTIDKQDLLILIGKVVSPFDKLRIIGDEFIVSSKYVEKCLSCFDDIIRVKSEEFVKSRKKPSSSSIVADICSEECDQSASSRSQKGIMKIKSGGGQRGREIKNKVVKNKYFVDKQTKKESHDSEDAPRSFIGEEEAVSLLATILDDDAPPELYQSIFEILERQLDLKYRKECHSVILQTSETARIKGDHRKLDSVVSMAINKIKVIERSLTEVKSIPLQTELTKYCLRSLCTDLTNSLFESIANDNEIEFDLPWTNETRSKLISHIKPELAAKMKSINKSIKDDQSLIGFYEYLEDICTSLDLYAASSAIKKIDKKLEKRVVQEMGASYQAVLEERLSGGTAAVDPGEVLLLATMLLYQRLVGWPLHASGKFVPDLIGYLQQHHSEGFEETVDWLALKSYQQYVVGAVRAGGEEREALRAANEAIQGRLVAMALSWKAIKKEVG